MVVKRKELVLFLMPSQTYTVIYIYIKITAKTEKQKQIKQKTTQQNGQLTSGPYV